MRVRSEEAQEVAEALLAAAGTPAPHSRIQAETLVSAEMRGHPSHGLLRLPRLLERIDKGLIDPQASGDMHWLRPSELRVDGLRGLGPVIAFNAIEQLISRAADTGIAFAAISNANHLGMLSVYVEAVAEQGKICIAVSTSEALVHPYGGTQAMLGTNPIAIGVPTSNAPFVLDLATSVVSMGKIHDHALRGAALKDGWALDEDGNPTTDAERAKKGSIAPFGDAKGYGLGLAIELLVGGLVGSAFAPDVRGTLDADNVSNKGDLFIVIDPIGGAQQFTRISQYLDAVRSSRPAHPTCPVLTPGDRARHRRHCASEHGFDVNDALWADLRSRINPSSLQSMQELQS
jgi:L-2-hydroxycarboxylate dehydrogenase (NAD+)